jgi:hypothetical protein
VGKTTHDEQVLDLVHKGIYAVTTGILLDHFNPDPAPMPRAGWTVGIKP